MKNKFNIAIFASGAGSNALKIIQHFQQPSEINISLIISNKAEAGVVEIANQNNIRTIILERKPFFESDKYVLLLKEQNIDLIVLAGFLWKIPANLVAAFPDRIINIHPALLPKYGGKGMYGNFVHQAVIDAKDKISGITIHLVDEQYDHGKHLFQAECSVVQEDTVESLAQKIHALEHRFLPEVIEKYCQALMNNQNS
ncbi:phosphoribosylglycinamide formyltransferase [Arachidicoccus sp.]|uniref:phosphoribosylglycinamide formyltransferase n=1 Tax=Arachidicoccus sp. TaxID=1872624 RepID=UPI003D1DD752